MNKKLKIANSISYISFGFVFLIYLFLPLLMKNAAYLIFLIIPIIFFCALMGNLGLKYDVVKSESMDKLSKFAVLSNTSLNGIDSAAINVAGTNWEEKQKQIKQYPSIEPVWTFIMICSVIFSNFIFSAVLCSDGREIINFGVMINVSILSSIILFITLISSCFSLYYNNSKEDFKKSMRSFLILFGIVVVFFCISFLPYLISNYNSNKEREEFNKRIENINKVIENTNKLKK